MKRNPKEKDLVGRKRIWILFSFFLFLLIKNWLCGYCFKFHSTAFVMKNEVKLMLSIDTLLKSVFSTSLS
jgi:hypothetical protein